MDGRGASVKKVDPNLFLAAIAAPVPAQIPTTGLIEFRFRVNDGKVIFHLNPDKWDSFKQFIGDLQNYARDEGNDENHRFLLHLAGQIEVLGMNLFTLDYQYEGDQD